MEPERDLAALARSPIFAHKGRQFPAAESGPLTGRQQKTAAKPRPRDEALRLAQGFDLVAEL